MPLLEGLAYLEVFYHIIEKRDELTLTKNLEVREQNIKVFPKLCHQTLSECDCFPVSEQKYILQFFRAVIDQQTWSDSGTVSERRLRSEVLSLACHLEYPPCLERANQHFKDWLHSNGTLKSV